MKILKKQSNKMKTNASEIENSRSITKKLKGITDSHPKSNDQSY